MGIIMESEVNQYLTLITALASASVGGVVAFVGIYLTNKGNNFRLKLQIDREEMRNEKRILRDRGEELYELVDRWLNNLAGHYLSLNSVMQGKLKYNQFLDLQIEQAKNNSYNFGRIEMLIDVYFPSSKPSYNEILKHRTELNEISRLHKKDYELGLTDGTKYIQPYIQAQVNIEESGNALKQQLIELIRNI